MSHWYQYKKGKLMVIMFLISIFFWFGVNVPRLFNYTYDAVYNSSGSVRERAVQLENSFNENIKGKRWFIDFNGLVHRLLGQREMNTVYRLDNGKLTFVMAQQDVSEYVSNLASLNDWMKTMGIPLLYVQPPFKVNKWDPQLPVSIEDYSNANADSLLNGIAERGVDALDLRELIRTEGLDHYSLFFDYDLHWRPQTGFWAYQKIMETLNVRQGYVLNDELMDLSNYCVDEYDDLFFGGQARFTGYFFAGKDDFSLIYPKFDTNMHFEVPWIGLSSDGRFEDVIFNYDCIQDSTQDFYDYYSYSAYCYGDNPIAYFRNENAPNQAKLLIVKDSFGLTVAPYLALAFSEVDMIDLRWYQDMTLKEYIETNRPDTVIVLVDPYQFALPLFTFE